MIVARDETASLAGKRVLDLCVAVTRNDPKMLAITPLGSHGLSNRDHAPRMRDEIARGCNGVTNVRSRIDPHTEHH